MLNFSLRFKKIYIFDKVFYLKQFFDVTKKLVIGRKGDYIFPLFTVQYPFLACWEIPYKGQQRPRGKNYALQVII